MQINDPAAPLVLAVPLVPVHAVPLQSHPLLATDAVDAMVPLVDALRHIEAAGTLVDVLRRASSTAGGASAGDRMRAVAQDTGGGWLLTSWRDAMTVPPEALREQFATALSDVIVKTCTPVAASVARGQLRGYLSSREYEHRRCVVEAAVACYDEVSAVAQLREITRGMRNWPSGDAQWAVRRTFARQVLSRHFGVDPAAVGYLALNGSDRQHEDLVEHLPPSGLSASDVVRAAVDAPSTHSPRGVLRWMLQRSRLFSGLPPDVFDAIAGAATATRERALHVALASRVDGAGCEHARFYRAHLQECLAVSIAACTTYSCTTHLAQAADALRVTRDLVSKLERVVGREARRQAALDAARDGLHSAHDRKGGVLSRDAASGAAASGAAASGAAADGAAPLPMLNTLVVCDTFTMRSLRTSEALRGAGLVVRAAHGNANLSTALHADILCVTPSALRMMSHLRFVRCVWFSVPVTRQQPPQWLRAIASHVWVARVHGGEPLSSSPFPPHESRHVFGYPMMYPRLVDAPRVAVVLPSLVGGGEDGLPAEMA